MKAFLTLVFVLVAGASYAQQISRQQMQEVRTACEADLQRLCSGIQPGGGKILQCLQDNASEVSSGCTAKLNELKAARQ